MGTVFVYQLAQLTGSRWSVIPYLSISLSLNILLTLMIAIRLILHARNTRAALGITKIGGLCKAIVVMLVESCALYAVSSLLFIGPWGAGNNVANFFSALLGYTQVRAFPQPRPSDRLSNMTTDWAGHRSTARYSTSRQQKRVGKQYRRLWTRQRVQG